MNARLSAQFGVAGATFYLVFSIFLLLSLACLVVFSPIFILVWRAAFKSKCEAKAQRERVHGAAAAISAYQSPNDEGAAGGDGLCWVARPVHSIFN